MTEAQFQQNIIELSYETELCFAQVPPFGIATNVSNSEIGAGIVTALTNGQNVVNRKLFGIDFSTAKAFPFVAFDNKFNIFFGDDPQRSAAKFIDSVHRVNQIRSFLSQFVSALSLKLVASRLIPFHHQALFFRVSSSPFAVMLFVVIGVDFVINLMVFPSFGLMSLTVFSALSIYLIPVFFSIFCMVGSGYYGVFVRHI